MKTVGIFPASGGLGSSTAAHLRKLMPNDHLVLISRYPEKQPKEYAESGTQLRKATFEDPPEQLAEAFKGVDVLFLISYPSHLHDYRVKVHTAALDAAVRAGVSHVFYSSLAFAGDVTGNSSRANVMHAHLATEAHLRALADAHPGKFSYTSVREGLYSESVGHYTGFPDTATTGSESEIEVRIPHDGKGPGVAWVKRDELGEATARLIARFAAGEDRYDDGIELVNSTVLLTGPRVWTLQETAELLQTLTKRPVRIREVSVDEYVSQPQVLAVFGSEDVGRMWATTWDAIRDGETAVVTPTLERVLGRAPEAYDVTLAKVVLG
ncbi:hypothetical protein MAPG_08194 [Magnaporthiopsis poae ATCC 64411]|uniref:NmrA-like domain-containing protein n=1 Tax=Magnaporthiopsis poae (strain ATCC 64411 / 73-15) TaxID=644358 RepID=A0A0C4E6P8_MAGP6|nr:hypothetical protein MAPG_08194 [Magnaporthiopsis poae ATCC 64411]